MLTSPTLPQPGAYEEQPFIDATMLIRAKRFFHLFVPSGPIVSEGGIFQQHGKAFAMAAFCEKPPGLGSEDLRCDFDFFTDQAFFDLPPGASSTDADAAPWNVQLKSISPKVRSAL